MLTWSCEQVRAELSAFHDEELPVADRIAIADHLDGCPSCRLEADDLELIGEALQATARVEDVAVDAGPQPPADRHPRALERRGARVARTHHPQSVRRSAPRIGQRRACRWSRRCFWRWARFVLAQSPIRHPESLKAAMTLSSRARTADIYLPAVEMLPRAYADAIMPATVMNRDDEEVAFAALVTADGYLEDVEIIGDRIQGRRSLPTHAQLSELLNAVATARFEPARAAGAPVSQNVVWLVSHTTVRAPLRAYIHVRVDGWKML